MSTTEQSSAGSVKSLTAILSSAMVVLSALFWATPTFAGDWPCWGGKPSRNMACDTEKGLPDWYSLGSKNDKGATDLSTTKNIKWFATVGDRTWGSPVVSQGKVFIGTAAGSTSSDAALLCFDEQSGRELGRFTCGQPHTDNFGVCSSPAIDGERLYLVTPQAEVVCLDVASWPTSPDAAPKVLWRYDMMKILHVAQDHVASCSPLVYGDYVYVCTGNGRYKYKGKPWFPLTPSLIAFNKHTGQLVARDDEQIGEQLWRGQWSSPSLAMVNGKPQILFATGNGLCYGFEPVDPAANVAPNRWTTTTLRGPIVNFIDVAGKETAGLSPGEYAGKFNLLDAAHKPALPVEFRYTIGMPVQTPLDSIPTAQVPDVPILKKIWSFDCLPAEFRNAPFFAHHATGDGRKHPTDIIPTPVFYKNRVYLAIGGDPNHGSKTDRGYLVCIDATKTGDITHTGKIWDYDQLGEALTTVAITGGLLFIIDEQSVIHCLDAETGQKYWTYALKSDRGPLGSALLAADGKIFAGKSILAASKELKVLCTIDGFSNNICSQPCAANGVVFMVHGKSLWAICDKRDKKPESDASK